MFSVLAAWLPLLAWIAVV